MAGTLNPKDTSLLIALMGKLKYTEYQFNSISSAYDGEKLEQCLSAILKYQKRNIRIKIVDNKPIVNIDLKLLGNIDEYSGNTSDGNGDLKKTNSQMQQELNKHCNKVINYLQKIDSDPIGIGNIVRARYKNYWKTDNWHNIYKNAVIHVNVKLKTAEHGASAQQ